MVCHAGERAGSMQIIVMQSLQDPARLQQLQDRGVLQWVDGVQDYNALNPERLAERLRRCDQFGIKRYWASLRPDYSPEQARHIWDNAGRHPGQCKLGWFIENDDVTRSVEKLKAIIDQYGAVNVLPYGVHTDRKDFGDAIGQSGATCVMSQWYWKTREQAKGGGTTDIHQAAPYEPSLYPFRKTLGMKDYVKEHHGRDIDLWFAIHGIGVWTEAEARGRPEFAPVYIPNNAWDFLCTLLAMEHAGFKGAAIYIHSVGGPTPAVDHIDRDLGVALKAYRTGDLRDWPLVKQHHWLYSPAVHDALQQARRGDVNGDGVVDAADRAVVEQNLGTRVE
jgi:hypothetical protein